MPASRPVPPASLPARRALLAGLAATALASFAGCGRKAPRGQAVPPGATVLALGDSLTLGVGAGGAEAAYPAVLAHATGWKVVNAGVSGNTSAQALARLPGLLEKHRPSLVIVSIGGNDFLRRQSAASTRANVRQICADALASGAQVLLVAVPEPTLMAAVGRLSDHAMYADIASELKVALHSGGWTGVLAQERLRADPIHANAAGYAEFVLGLVQTLKDTGFWAG